MAVNSAIGSSSPIKLVPVNGAPSLEETNNSISAKKLFLKRISSSLPLNVKNTLEKLANTTIAEHPFGSFSLSIKGILDTLAKGDISVSKEKLSELINAKNGVLQKYEPSLAFNVDDFSNISDITNPGKTEVLHDNIVQAGLNIEYKDSDTIG